MLARTSFRAIVIEIQGLSEQHTSIQTYLKKRRDKQVDHSHFMQALKTYIRLHNENPASCRVHGRRDLEIKESVTKSTAEGEMVYSDFDFVELWAWRDEHPNQEPDKIVKRMIKGKEREGVLVATQKAGHFHIREYDDDRAERKLHLQDAGDPVLDDAQIDRKYEAARSAAVSSNSKEALSFEDFQNIISQAGEKGGGSHSSDGTSSSGAESDEDDDDPADDFRSKLLKRKGASTSNQPTATAAKAKAAKCKACKNSKRSR